MEINKFRFVSLMALVISLLALPATSSADDWKKHKEDCDKVFKASTTVIFGRLKECVAMWLAYADPNTVRAREMQAYKSTFQALYDRSVERGDEEGEFNALQAATNLNLKLALRLKREKVKKGGDKRDRGRSGSDESATASKRKKFEAPEVGKDDRRKAEKHVEKGKKYFKKGKRSKAESEYRKALEFDPGNLDGLFNLAAEQAYREEKRESVDNLQKLQDIGTKGALKRLKWARKDEDFRPLHDYPPFKTVTGFARIKVLNSLDEFGEDEVERIVKTLEKLDYPVEERGDDKQKGRKAPVIWFKDHSVATAYLVKQVVVHPGVRLTKITWKSKWDIIVSWGNRLVVKDGVKQPKKDYTDVSPDDAEKNLEKLSREEDRVMRKPEEYARKVDHTIDTPKRVERKIENMQDRAERTKKTVEKTSDKIKSIFK